MTKVSYCIDTNCTELLYNFEKRGWIHVGPEDNWNLYWSSIHTCHCLFNPMNNYRLNDNQLINHFPNHYELSRKDLLIRNIRRYQREIKNTGNLGTKHARREFSYFDSIPSTYILPVEYYSFLEDFRKKSNTWIMKPWGKSRGTGIFLINKLSQVTKWLSQKIKKENYIISRYIGNPFLICGKKFDIRLYVLVTSFRPLKAYQFKYGFCRFCSVKYDAPASDISCLFAHLTNTSVQKEGDQYNNVHGGKWSTENLKLYLTSIRGQKTTQTLFENISRTIILSLKAVSKVISQDKHCFECYGYDIIVDENLKPWLIEVNSSPSLTSTTVSDQMLKSKLVESILSLVLPPTGIPNSRWDKNPTPESLVNFDVLINETQR